MLDGFELAAAAWERSVLPARVDGYEPAMLDMLCLAGEVGVGAALSPPAADASVAAARPTTPRPLVPATPIALFLREHAERLAGAARTRSIPRRFH